MTSPLLIAPGDGARSLQDRALRVAGAAVFVEPVETGVAPRARPLPWGHRDLALPCGGATRTQGNAR